MPPETGDGATPDVSPSPDGPAADSAAVDTTKRADAGGDADATAAADGSSDTIDAQLPDGLVDAGVDVPDA